MSNQLNNIIQSILQREHHLNPIQALYNTELLMRIICQHGVDDSFVVTDYGNGTKQVTQAPLAKAVILTIAHCMGKIGKYYPACNFNPYLDVFIKNAGNGGLLEAILCHEALNNQYGSYNNDMDYRVFKAMADSITAFINNTRLEMQSPSFRSMINKAQRVSKTNHDRLEDYINSLFAVYARLLVLRVDFGYHVDNATVTQQHVQLRYQEAKSDFRHFLDNRDSNNLFEHQVGYVWKLEYGFDKSWHYHVLFFLDGSKVREDINIAMLFGKYWEKITQGRGVYYNCNANKHQYTTLGIGMINHYDANLRQGLSNAAAYLIKPDLAARMLVPDNGRTFGRGEMLKPKHDNQPGRPRSLSSGGLTIV